ncbi:hypothetical protein AB6C74_03700 [Vibrio splendidus]
MMTDNELKLLIALLKNVDKYGLQTFLSLKEKVTKQADLDFNFLEKVAREKSNNFKHKVNYKVEVEKYLNGIDINKKLAVNDLINSFQSKSRIKNLSEVSSYFNRLGFSDKKISSWQEGMFILVKGLSKHKFDLNYIAEIQNEFESQLDDDRSLERWSEIILSKQASKK